MDSQQPQLSEEARKSIDDIQVDIKPKLEPKLEPIEDSTNFKTTQEVDIKPKLEPEPEPKPEPDPIKAQEQGLGSQEFFQCGIDLGMHNTVVNDSDLSAQLDYLHFDFHQDDDHRHYGNANNDKQRGHDFGANIFSPVNPQPSALSSKCALWYCQEFARGSECLPDYCNTTHADLASSEGSPGMNPVLPPGGIGLKDDRLLLSSLIAKIQKKNVNVGIPECHGAAIFKWPWKASKLFDLSLLEAENIQEVLFFDKPKKAFKSGNRKQRSLPDYSGRRWRQSRKQLMKDLGGHKRSFYMDPRPSKSFEWHLFEYEVTSSDSFALYKLKVVSVKKSPKRKGMNDSVVDLQKQMEDTLRKFPDTKHPVKGGMKTDQKADSEC